MTNETTRAVLLHTNGTMQHVTLRRNNIQDIYDFIGCDVFTCVSPSAGSTGAKEGVSVYVDDEGLLKDNTPVNIWSIALCPLLGHPAPLVGNILLLGPTDAEGYDTDVKQAFLQHLPPQLRPSPELQFHFFSKEDS